MIRSTRLHQPGWLSGAIHLVIIVIAFKAETGAVWPYALMAMAVVSFFAWVANYRRYRQIHDLPTSKVASAAQGYVELVGSARPIPGTPVLSRLSLQPCCWFHFVVSEKDSNGKWKQVESGTSDEHFLMVDDTGQCVISPQGAEVLTQDFKSWTQGNHRYEEWLLLPNSVLYALGEFTTLGGPSPEQASRDERADVSALIAEWKRDRKRLHERFDLNRDGAIDMKEWERARLEAQREVRRRHGELRAIEGVHMLRKPRDGRLFLLANEMPERLGARYRIWSGVHLVIFLGCGTVGLMLM
jgi:hypothetical protein